MYSLYFQVAVKSPRLASLREDEAVEIIKACQA